jgi:uncharacterized protein YjdB
MNSIGSSVFNNTSSSLRVYGFTENTSISTYPDITFIPYQLAISLNPPEPHTFNSVLYGYVAQAPLTITVANVSDIATGALSVVLIGKDTTASSFTLSRTDIPSIAANAAATFTIAPKTGLGAGTHTATVMVYAAADNGNAWIMPQGLDVSFTVNEFTSVTGITLNKTTTALTVGATDPLTATVAPTNATNRAVSWTTSNPAVATVSTSGVVTAVGAGTATITVTTANGGFAASCVVTVSPPFIPVTNITSVPTVAIAGTPLTLTGTVAPSNATNQTITWSVASVGTTGATISGNTLNTTAAGTVQVRATVANGSAVGTNYTQDFTITVNPMIIPVTGITLNKTTATLTAGATETLIATIVPTNATNKSVSWTTSNPTVATVSTNGVVTAVGAGTATITVTTGDGGFTASCAVTVNLPFIPVTNITGVSTITIAGTPLTLTGTVAPSNATNQTIAWSVASAGTTGAAISGNTLSTTAAGTVTVMATIVNGTAVGTNYTQNFTITVNTPFIPVTNITGVPTTATVGTPLTLVGTVVPSNVTNQAITWSVASVGTTGAAISGNTLNTTAAGIVQVRATIANGSAVGTNYTQDFTITVNAPFIPITSITGGSATAVVGTPLVLTGTPIPSNATNRTVTWSVVSAGTTGATISGNTLSTTATGTATVRATIVDGTAVGTNYTQNFTITVGMAIIPVTGVTLDKTTATLTVGNTETLIATVIPTDATDKTVSWATSNSAVATVSTGGIVTATGVGTATITVTTTDGGFTATCAVTVNALIIPVADITLNKTTTALTVGDTEALIATVIPSDAMDKTVAWATSNSAIVTVSTGGIVTATGVGTATITVTTTDGGFMATCEVTVNALIISVTDITLNKTIATLTVGETETLVATVVPTNATDKTVLWTTSNPAIATIVDGVVTAISTGTATITATTDDGSFTAVCVVTVGVVSVLSSDREISPTLPETDAAIVTPINVLTASFTVGPNPVSRSSGVVNFYYEGKRIDDGILTIYDASGNIVNKTSISDRRGDLTWSSVTGVQGQPRRLIGSWDLKDARGRGVSEGTYLLRGLVTVDGRRERVSVIIVVR